MVTNQSAHEKVAAEIESKPRTVSTKGGEDDATCCSIDTKFVDVSPEAGCVQKYTAYMSKCSPLSYEDEQPLIKDTCMHAESLQAMCIWKDEKRVQVEMIISCALDFHALEEKQGKEYSNYFGEPHLQGGIKESMMDLVCLLTKISCNVRIKYIYYFIFLFLPWKERVWNGLLIRDQLTLKEVGWGPPADRDALDDVWRISPY